MRLLGTMWRNQLILTVKSVCLGDGVHAIVAVETFQSFSMVTLVYMLEFYDSVFRGGCCCGGL